MPDPKDAKMDMGQVSLRPLGLNPAALRAWGLLFLQSRPAMTLHDLS